MKYAQLLFSPAGGTQRAAEIMTSVWGEDVETVDLCNPEDDFSLYSFAPEDIVLIGLPSYAGRVPKLAAERLLQVRGNSAKCVLLCVYGNRAYEDTLVEMEDIARKCGFVVSAAVAAVAEHSIMHQFASGRPDEKDRQELKSYAETILAKIKNGTYAQNLQMPGNRPYKKAGSVGMVPKASSDCVNCGVCAKRCPAQAISPEDVKKTDAEKCISCMRCTVECPHSARTVNKAMLAAASLALKKACSSRKENELFC